MVPRVLAQTRTVDVVRWTSKVQHATSIALRPASWSCGQQMYPGVKVLIKNECSIDMKNSVVVHDHGLMVQAGQCKVKHNPLPATMKIAHQIRRIIAPVITPAQTDDFLHHFFPYPVNGNMFHQVRRLRLVHRVDGHGLTRMASVDQKGLGRHSNRCHTSGQESACQALAAWKITSNKIVNTLPALVGRLCNFCFLLPFRNQPCNDPSKPSVSAMFFWLKQSCPRPVACWRSQAEPTAASRLCHQNNVLHYEIVTCVALIWETTAWIPSIVFWKHGVWHLQLQSSAVIVIHHSNTASTWLGTTVCLAQAWAKGPRRIDPCDCCTLVHL